MRLRTLWLMLRHPLRYRAWRAHQSRIDALFRETDRKIAEDLERALWSKP